MVMAIAAFTFSSCEDVPEPYGWPNPSNNNSGIDPTGEGTFAEPFNVSKVNQLMESGEYSENAIYCVQGVVSQIREVDPSYGNATFYISDDGTTANQFYVYRGYGLNNTKFTSEDALQVGDTVIVAGKLVNYNGTYEFAQGNYLVRLNDQIGDAPDQGGSTEGATGDGTYESPFNIAGANKYIEDGGSSEKLVFVKGKISSIKSIDTGSYGNAEYYISDDGKASNQFYVYRGYGLNNVKFTSEDQIKVGDEVIIYGKLVNYNGTYEFAQGNYLVRLNDQIGDVPSQGGNTEGATGDGTYESPFNIAGANKYIEDGGSSDNLMYVKGKISSIKSIDTGSYGNAEYYISDDGTTAKQFYVYRGYGLNNAKFTSEDQIKVGDDVIICGKLVNFKGTYEFAQGSYIVLLNGEGNELEPVGEAKGSGTLADPYNSVAVINYINTLGADTESSEDVYIKGKVVSVKEQYGTQYGNATFYISDDGTATNQFYVFRALYLGNQKYTAGAQIKAGDEVVVCGKVINYKGNTPETAANKAYLYSLNGETESNGEEPGEEPGSDGVEGNSIDFTSMGYTNTQDFEGVSVKVGDATLTFSKGTGKTTPKYYSAGGGAIRLYGSNTLTITSEKEIKSVKFTYSDDYNGNSYYATAENSSVAPGSYDFSTHIWTLGAKEGVLTYTANGGHLRIVTVSIEY